jgi:tRNA G18 (ribose-2'-O)-methylase SpoU
MQDEGDESRYPDHVLATDELRRSKPNRAAFTSLPRNPVTVVLDGVTGNYNLGAIFRLCDAFMVERLIICRTAVSLRKRKLIQAAAGAQRWVPWHGGKTPRRLSARRRQRDSGSRSSNSARRA